MPRPIRSAYRIPYGAAFGAMRAGGKRRHNGTDYHCPVGTPIYGTGEGGKVLHIGYNGDPWMGLGHNITIVYPDGKTLDAHMQYRTPLGVGSYVGPNTLVGYVGLTGNAVNADPPGSHLHHERRKNNGLLVNPEVYYGASPAGDGSTPIEDEMNKEQDDRLKNIEKALGAMGALNVKIDDADTVLAMVRQVRDVLGAAGGANTETQNTVAYLMRDASAALTRALPEIAARGDKLVRYLSDGGEDVAGTIGDPGSVFGRVINLQAQIAGLTEAVKALAVGQGLDPDAITEAARKGAAEALEGIQLAVLKD